MPNNRKSRLLWLLAPFVGVITFVIIGIPLLILAALSIPYFALFPDRHAHIWDFRGTHRQRELLARWRAMYRQLGLRGRIARAIKKRHKRTRWQRSARLAS